MTGRNCYRCGSAMEPGRTTAIGFRPNDLTKSVAFNLDTEQTTLVFVTPGVKTSLNPVRAFQQGLAGEPRDAVHRLGGFRCTECGTVELVAEELFEGS